LNILDISRILEAADDQEQETNRRPKSVRMSKETFELIKRILHEQSVLQPAFACQGIEESMIYKMAVVEDDTLPLGDFKVCRIMSPLSQLVPFFRRPHVPNEDDMFR